MTSSISSNKAMASTGDASGGARLEAEQAVLAGEVLLPTGGTFAGRQALDVAVELAKRDGNQQAAIGRRPGRAQRPSCAAAKKLR